VIYGLSSNIIRVIKTRRIRRAGHVARMGRGEVYTGLWWGNLREKDHLEDPGVDGRIILRLSSGSRFGGMDWIDLAQERYRRRAFLNAVMNIRVP
jgi:hypothetical protein